MAKKYYLVNGENKEAIGLKLLVNGNIKRDFNDISDLDLQTMKIPYEKAKDILLEYNDKIELKNEFFDVEYPYKDDETKASHVIFQHQNTILKPQFETLQHIAEERSYQKRTNQSVKVVDSKEVQDYIIFLLSKIIETNDPRFTQGSSLLYKDIKDIIYTKMSYRASAPYEIQQMLKYDKTNEMLHNYTQLRLLFIEYANYLKQIAYYTDANQLKKFNTYKIDNLKPYVPLTDNQVDLFAWFEEKEQEEAKKQKEFK